MNPRGLLIVASLLPLAAPCQERLSAGTEEPPGRIAIFRYDDAPDERRPAGNPEAMTTPGGARMLADGREVATYVLVLRLAPGERFVRATVEARDGRFCVARRARRASRVLGRIGVDLLVAEAAPALHPSIGLLADLVLPDAAARPAPRLERRIKLRARDVESHEGYAVLVLPMVAGSLTRLVFPRLVIEAVAENGRRSRRKLDAAPVVVPGPQDAGINRERLIRILSGRGAEASDAPETANPRQD